MTTNFNTTPMHTDDITAALALLDAHPDFRVLRSLPPAESLVSTLPPVLPLRVAAILDCETTGLSADFDEVIELAVQRVGSMALVGSSRSDSRGRGYSSHVSRWIRRSSRSPA